MYVETFTLGMDKKEQELTEVFYRTIQVMK